MNIMKKTYIYNLILVSALVVFTPSCKKALTLDPVDTIEKGKALLTSKDVEGAMVGAYADLGSVNLYGGRAFIMADFLANTDAIEWFGTYDELTQAINKSLRKTNLFVDNIWRDGFKTINDVNNILASIDKVDADWKKSKIQGEALFIRGAVYFELVKLFGRSYNDGSPTVNLGVPIVLTPTQDINPDSYVARATVAAVYKQAIDDLTASEAKFIEAKAKNSNFVEQNGFFANKYVAAAMLARVYLQKGDYTNAANAATRVFDSPSFKLAPTYDEAFPRKPEEGQSPLAGFNTVEDVFAMQVTSLTGSNGFNEFYGSSTFGGRGDATISQDWIDNNYLGSDERKNSFYEDGGDIFPYKFGNRLGNVPIIRLAEIYLIRAEANARISPSSNIGGKTALEDLTVVRARVGLTTASATVDDILKERKLELAFEGSSLHDIKRAMGKVGTLDWNSSALVLPIPQREIDANKKLVQNDGYTN